MEKLGRELNAHSIIELDTSIFIYHFEAHPKYLPITKEILAGVESGHWKAITSVITLMEISIRPLQLGYRNIARNYEALLVNFPNLRIVDLDRDITRLAAQLRAKYRIRPADALQASAVLYHSSKIFITNDQQLKRLQPELKILLLEDLI